MNFGFQVLGFGYQISLVLRGGVSGFGVRSLGLGLRPQRPCFRVPGFRVWGLGFRISIFGFRMLGLGFLVSGFRFRVSGFGFQVSGFELCAPGFEFQASGFAVRAPVPRSSCMAAFEASMAYSLTRLHMPSPNYLPWSRRGHLLSSQLAVVLQHARSFG